VINFVLHEELNVKKRKKLISEKMKDNGSPKQLLDAYEVY
jgi:hypothetical protein